MKKIYVVIVFLSIFVLNGCQSFNTYCDNGKCYVDNNFYDIEFQIKGNESIQIPLYEEYKESGAMVLLDNNDISNELIITGEVDTNTPGIYEIVYSVEVNEKNYYKTRSIEVLQFELFNFYLLGSTEIYLDYGVKYIDAGYVAVKTDTNENLHLDVTITGYVDEYTSGTYILRYALEYYDEIIIRERKVTVNEYNSFEFELNGHERIHIYLGQEYEDGGVLMAFDTLDRINYINRLNVVNEVDENTLGIYYVVYSVTVQGIYYEFTREVEVLSDSLEFRLHGDEVIHHKLGEEFVDYGSVYTKMENFIGKIY